MQRSLGFNFNIAIYIVVCNKVKSLRFIQSAVLLVYLEQLHKLMAVRVKNIKGSPKALPNYFPLSMEKDGFIRLC
jgi:hypothetical protein